MVSLTGTWVQSVAQQWLVLQLTNSPFKLGLVTTVQFTPVLLLSLIGGAIVDRVDRRKLLIATQIFSALLAAVLGALAQTGLVRYWHVLVIAALLGTVNAFYIPSRQAFVPQLVASEDLLNAVSLNSTIFNAARVAGPALGGVMIASVGVATNFYLNAASYVAVIIGLLLIRPRPAQHRENQGDSLWQNVLEGLRYIVATPVVYTILALIGVSSLFALNFTVLLPVFAREILHVGSSGFGILMASWGVGSLAGAILLAFFSRQDLARTLIYLGAITFTLLEIGFAFSHLYGLSIALLIGIGFSVVLFTTTANTRVLALTPEHLQGRVMSVYSLMFLGVTPFGSLFAGTVAEHSGAPIAMILGAAITLAFTLVIFAIRSAHRFPG